MNKLAWAICLLLSLLSMESYGMQASGRVFVDLNGNGRFDEGESGLAGVPISDGNCFVDTDADGHYQIDAGLDPLVNFHQLPILTVHWPTGYWPVGRFFRRLDASMDLKHVDFALRSDRQSLPFTFIHASDPHLSVKNWDKFQRFRCGAAALADSVEFCIITGDLTDGAKRKRLSRACQLYDLVGQATAEFPVPLLMIPGNVDQAGTNVLFKQRGSPLYGYGLYWQRIGPLRWSFDYAGVHFVGIDFMRVCGSRWKTGVPCGAVDWLAQDLMRVAPGARVFLFVHFPKGPGAFAEVIDDQVTHIFAGHLHGDRRRRYAGIPVTIGGSTSRIYLQPRTPVGYRLVTVTEDSLVMPYIRLR